MRTLAATTLEAPWGAVHLAATPDGLASVALMTPPVAFEAGLEARFGAPVRWLDAASAGSSQEDPATVHLRVGVAAILAALDGRDETLRALTLDLADRPAWDLAVLGAVRTIPRGETRSYGEIARQIGRHGAARAVGGAVGRNPLALAIPCHRVIAGDGTLGGYGGGWWGDHDRLLELKAELLAAEGHQVRRGPSGPGGGR